MEYILMNGNEQVLQVNAIDEELAWKQIEKCGIKNKSKIFYLLENG